MPILNYTTTISAHKTVGEIQEILAKAGAMAVSIDYGPEYQPEALMFLIRVRDVPVSFRLPSRWQGVYKRLLNDPKVPRAQRNEEQARRVAWRIVKDWCEAQLAIVDAGQAMLAEVFLPYAITQSGATIYQVFENNQKLLMAGEQ
jgi:uncharacterized protein YceK